MKVMIFASVASMVDLFNRDNIDMLMELGYEVTVACNFREGSVYSPDKAKQFEKELRIMGCDTIHVPVPRSASDIAGMVRTVQILRDDMHKKHYSIVHCQSPIGGVLARIAAYPFRKEGTKVIYFAHGFHFYTGAPEMNWLIYYNIEKICARFTDVLLTLNKEDYKRAKRHFDTDVRYIPGAGIDILGIIDCVPDIRMKRNELNIPAGKRIIISVCELSYRKNCETMIRAFVKAGREDAVLLMCGIGAQMDMLKELVEREGVSDRVIFAGFRDDIIELLKISDMFMFTSRQEGLPVALMQAMACKLPVLCSRIRGNVDLIKDTEGGYMYDCEDVDGFAEGISRILDDKEMAARMGERNFSNISGYDREIVNNIMKKIYLSMGDNDE